MSERIVSMSSLLKLSLALTLFASTSSAQVGPEWVTPLTFPATVDIRDVVIDPAGSTYAVGTANHDAYIVKCDASGTVAWSRTFDIPMSPNLYFTGLTLDPQRNVIVVGYEGTTGEHDALVAKYNPNGDLVWSIEHALAGPQRFDAVLVDANGDAYAMGYSSVAKVSAAGSILWVQTAPTGSTQDGWWHMALDPSGALYVGGTAGTYVGGYDTASSLVARLDAATGAVVWRTAFTPSADPWHTVNALTVDPAGNVYTAGRSWTDVPFNHSWIHVAKLDPSGTVAWTRSRLGMTSPYSSVGAVRVLAPDRIVVVGSLTMSPLGGEDFLTDVWDDLGTLVWSSTYFQPLPFLHGVGRSALLDADGDLISIGAWNSSLVVRSFDLRQGTHRWTRVLNSTLLQGSVSAITPEAASGSRIVVPVYDSTICRLASIQQHAQKVCAGDGSGSLCPCGNQSPSFDPSGCTNSLGSGGEINEDGVAAISADSLVLRGTGMPDSSALYFQGTIAESGGQGVVFGDGLRCAGGAIVRLGTTTIVTGKCAYPDVGDASVSVRGGVTAPGTRVYQVWYRNAASFCTAATFNLTNGLHVLWES